MSPCSTARRSEKAAFGFRGLLALLAAVIVTSVGCGSSDSKTQVLGEQEQQAGAEVEVVELLDAVCITNTPTQEPC